MTIPCDATKSDFPLQLIFPGAMLLPGSATCRICCFIGCFFSDELLFSFLGSDIMELDLAPIVLFVGNFGSGKTEVAVNFALNRLEEGEEVRIADLDVVNPYFRSREVRDILTAKGIRVVVPEEGLLEADLPIVIPQIKGVIEKPKGVTILDVGGDDVGATVLGSLNNAFIRSPFSMLQVINEKRPFTETVEDCLKIGRGIEAASRLKVTGIVGNSHLMDETSPETIYDGYEFSRNVAAELGLPLVFITCEERLIPELDITKIGCPILPITRMLLPPWRRREVLGSKNFLL